MSSLQMNSVVYAAQKSFSDSTNEYFLVKEIIEVTSDWQDVIWSQGFDVHTVRYSIIEGEEAIKNIRVQGLTAAIEQSLDTEKIVVEIEAIVIKNADTAMVEIIKGSIGYARVELQVYDVTQEKFIHVTSGGTQQNNKALQFKLDTLYAHPAGNMSLRKPEGP